MSTDPNSLPWLLVVDDEKANRDTVRAVFAPRYQVVEASCADEAMAVIIDDTAHEIGVAIVDIMMPGRDGIELLKEIKAQRRDISVIMLTAFENVKTAQAALRNGACDYQTKPWAPSDLIEAVKRAAGLRDTRPPEERVEALVAQLSQTEDQALKMSELSRIYAGAIHDFGNPLTALLGHSDLLLMRLENTSALVGSEFERFKSDFQSVFSIIERLAEVAGRGQRLLQHGRQVNEKNNPFAATLAATQIAEAHHSFRGNTLNVDARLEAGAINVIEADFEQAVLNLLLNAMQSRSGGVSVFVKARRVARRYLDKEGLSLSGWDVGDPRFFRESDELFDLQVSDNGPGIPDDLRSKVWEAHVTTKPTGSGIGLTSVAEIVSKANGAIRLTTSSTGTTFRILVPLT